MKTLKFAFEINWILDLPIQIIENFPTALCDLHYSTMPAVKHRFHFRPQKYYDLNGKQVVRPCSRDMYIGEGRAVFNSEKWLNRRKIFAWLATNAGPTCEWA
jgi:hypothetical protein